MASLSLASVSRARQYEWTGPILDLARDKQADFLRRSFQLPLAQVDSLRCEEVLDKPLPEMHIRASITALRYANKTGSRLFVPVAPLRSGPGRFTAERRHDLWIDKGYCDTDSLTLHLPEGYVVEALPKSVTIENRFGKVAFEALCSGDRLHIRIRLLRDIPRQPCMGCKTGVVVYYNERRDAFISVENETEDYYYPMRDDETLQPGDRVTFFATENLLYKRRRNAGKTMMADNVQYAGAAPSYRGRVVDKVTRQDAASGTTLFELTVAADDKRLPRSQVTITLYDTSNQRWSVISAWEKGTPCSFFIAKGKWYLHLTPDPAQTPSTENAHGE